MSTAHELEFGGEACDVGASFFTITGNRLSEWRVVGWIRGDNTRGSAGAPDAAGGEFSANSFGIIIRVAAAVDWGGEGAGRAVWGGWMRLS